ncbi:unnamed protein product [Enterobius vermicularis]|uniref:Rap-GAP domain-containing protein n=1 Tax=Enterobius vermicularis TaxID=51028 RepID=A0A0N4VC54_ENTVE|nr:unnamed protein product [Enterobius vermicularis]
MKWMHPDYVELYFGPHRQFYEMSDFNRGLKEITDSKLQRELTVLEDQEGCINCKFGVVFALCDQTTDAQMLSNEHGDEDFARFLELLGKTITLRNWGNYRGGLDTTTNSTGTESVFTCFAGHEIMFHVSTMLPYTKDNLQQVERKRHVGNDIVNIVFVSGGDAEHPNFSPAMWKSQFTHVFAVVTYEEKTNAYRLWVHSEETVPAFGPALPYPNVFADHQKFLINAEKAAHQARVFVEKRIRTLDVLLKDMYMEHLKENNKGFRKVTDIVIKHLRSPAKKSTSKEMVEFCKYGELVKLEKMLSGDISNSIRMSIGSKQPWEPELVFQNSLSWDAIGSDAWGTSAVLIATEDTGVIFECEGLSVPIIEARAKVMQLAVREHFGLFLARTDKGKESSLIVLALTDLRLAMQTGDLILRKTCIEHRIAASKGCHLFETSDPNGLRLYVVICIGKSLTLLRWAFGPLGRIEAGTDLTNNFNALKTVLLNEETTAISVYERGCTQCTVHTVAFTKAGIAMVDFCSDTVQYLCYEVPKATITSLYATSDGQVDEIIFSHKNITVTLETPGNGKCNVHETFWSSALLAFVCQFPFIVGFGQNHMEVRLSVNGNLLYSMYMPDVRVLSKKDDILFAVDHPTSPTATTATTGLPNSTKALHASLKKKEPKEQHSATIKRWCIYRISSTAMRVNEARNVRERALGGLTPQLLRKFKTNAETDSTFDHQLENSSRRICSTASDTTCGSGKYTGYSGPDSPSLVVTFDTSLDDDVLV